MKILVVDDEKDIQTLFEQRFRKEIKDGSLQFAFAFSGEEALAYLNGKEAILHKRFNIIQTRTEKRRV